MYKRASHIASDLVGFTNMFCGVWGAFHKIEIEKNLLFHVKGVQEVKAFLLEFLERLVSKLNKACIHAQDWFCDVSLLLWLFEEA